jgi:type II secretory pathway component GspD/PulD (secretin)
MDSLRKEFNFMRFLVILALLLTFLALVLIAKNSFAGTVTIINPAPAKYIKPLMPNSVANQRVTVKGFVTIKQLEFLLSGQINQTIELIGNGKSKAFVDFNNSRLINVLKYIKDVYGFDYRYSGGRIILDNVETATFHLPFTPLLNTVSASLGSSQNGSQNNTSGNASTTTSSTSSNSSSMGSGSSSSLGGYATENVSNISTPFFKKFLQTIKSVMGKKSSVMFSARMQTLVVSGKVKKVELVKKYVKRIFKRMKKVVFVKMKVVNVQLSSGYNYGINWSNLYSDMGHYLGAASSLAVNLSNTPTNSLAGADNITFNSGTGTNAVINALDNFGKVNIINQMKLEVLSGETRTLNNIGTVPYSIGNQVTTVGALGSTAQSTPQIGEATSGVDVVYTPEAVGNKVYISVQLILNTITGYTQLSGGVSVPDVSTQSVSFTISVPSGKSALVGALQYKSVNKNKEGVPILDDIPILGYLFSGGQMQKTNNELFLLVTPVIVNK